MFELQIAILAAFATVCLIFGIRCINDARKGGDFGQVYSWAFGVVSILLFLTFAGIATSLYLYR